MISIPSSAEDVSVVKGGPLLPSEQGSSSEALVPDEPERAGRPMVCVCVMTHRSSQTSPLSVPDFHRVVEGRGFVECPDHKQTFGSEGGKGGRDTDL